MAILRLRTPHAQVVLAGYADKMDAGSSAERASHVMTNRMVLGDAQPDAEWSGRARAGKRVILSWLLSVRTKIRF